MSIQQFFSFHEKPIASAVSLVLTLSVFSALIAIAASSSIDVVIQNSGRITLVGLGAYGGDVNSTNGAYWVDLGEIQLGSSKNISFYLRSVSNVRTKLAFSVDSWEPNGLGPFMGVSWDYSGKQIAPNEEIPIRINLNTPSSADFVNYLVTNQVTSFSFSLSIYVTES